ncbi:MAG: DegQ family serine endoprotease [Methylococcales bacterium]|nr:MAG: DegQ family serine endoprotease [Methylococcales bacterium]
MKIHLLKSLALLAFFSISTLTLAAGLPPFDGTQALPTLAPMLERSMPAVVNISTSKNIQVSENPLMQDPVFRQFFNVPNQSRQQQQKNSLGSGVIIDSKQGLVLTNNHVIDKADSIMVTLHDGRQLNAELIGTDPESDVAVIKIPSNNLSQLTMADSSLLKVGDFVVAIGNPFGLGQTVTSGIVSALGRSGLGIEKYENFIQTDASINPGNSGGALVNLRGELIGMNTAILAPTGGNVGIGFAIPSNMINSIKDALVKHGVVKRGLLGVTTQDLTPDLVNAFNLETQHGAAISRIENDSPAAKAGLEPGDIIVGANDKPINNSQDINNLVGLLQIGDKVTIDYFHGTEKKAVTAIIAKPELTQVAGEKLHRLLQGTVLSATAKNQLEGISIDKINTASYAWMVGLRPGDVIVSANRYRVHNLDEFKSAVNPNSAVLINIQRGDQGLFVVLR